MTDTTRPAAGRIDVQFRFARGFDALNLTSAERYAVERENAQRLFPRFIES